MTPQSSINRLNIIETEQIITIQRQRKPSVKRNTQREVLQKKMEELWDQHSEQFDPTKNCMEMDRIQKTLDLILKDHSLKNKHVADIGCGMGIMAKHVCDSGGIVDAVDIAKQAVESLKNENATINVIQNCFPMLTLEDDYYDLVICTEVIGYLPPQVYTLCILELSRILKSDGMLVFSTQLDKSSEEPIQLLYELVKTEFDIQECTYLYHSLFINLCRFFEWPFKIGASALKRSKTLMNIMEKSCRFILPRRGISHVLFTAKRRKHQFPTN